MSLPPPKVQGPHICHLDVYLEVVVRYYHMSPDLIPTTLDMHKGPFGIQNYHCNHTVCKFVRAFNDAFSHVNAMVWLDIGPFGFDILL
jgi:hypothetical protein